jgi:hypothetical protein
MMSPWGASCSPLCPGSARFLGVADGGFFMHPNVVFCPRLLHFFYILDAGTAGGCYKTLSFL